MWQLLLGVVERVFLPMLLFINEIDFKAFGPFNDVDGTDVKLFLAMFKSYGYNERKKTQRTYKRSDFSAIFS